MKSSTTDAHDVLREAVALARRRNIKKSSTLRAILVRTHSPELVSSALRLWSKLENKFVETHSVKEKPQ